VKGVVAPVRYAGHTLKGQNIMLKPTLEVGE